VRLPLERCVPRGSRCLRKRKRHPLRQRLLAVALQVRSSPERERAASVCMASARAEFAGRPKTLVIPHWRQWQSGNAEALSLVPFRRTYNRNHARPAWLEGHYSLRQARAAATCGVGCEARTSFFSCLARQFREGAGSTPRKLTQVSASSQVWGDAERSYNLGLSARGQAALRELGCMEDVGMHTTGVNPPRAPARIDGKPAAA
jgi:hypothetical protein